MYEDEKSKQKGYSEKISEWLKQFALTGQVDPKDIRLDRIINN